MDVIQNYFKIHEKGSTIKTEIEAGVTSFASMVYIVAVNALVLSATGMDYEAVMLSTIFVSSISCILMGIFANTPMILAPGMSDNAFFTYTLVGALAFSWQQGLSIVFIVGVLYWLICRFRLVDYLVQSMSDNLIYALSAGIGFFLMFLGLKNGEIIISNPATIVGLNNILQPVPLTTLLTLFIALFLYVREIKFNFLLSILLGSIVSIVLGVVELSTFSYQLLPLSRMSSVFFQLDFTPILTFDYWVAVFSLLVLVLFQNLGTQLSFLGKERKYKINRTLEINAISVILASLLGCSSTCTNAEGSTGISVGGRTGVTSIFVGFLFVLTLFFIPFIALIDISVISALLILVGAQISAGNLSKIDFTDFTEFFPGIFMVLMIILTFNIADGIGMGFIVYTFIKVASNKVKEISLMMWGMTGIFMVYFVMNFL